MNGGVGPARPRPPRSDTRRNQQRILRAIAEIAREGPEHLTMQAVARRAEVGAATAYRYYSSVQELLATYTLRVVEELRAFSDESSLDGPDLFAAVLSRWMELLDEHGHVMVRLRSHRGFLERLEAGDEVIATWVAAWTEPVAALLAEVGCPRDQLPHGLFLANIIFDPREIADLRNVSGLGDEAIRARLTSVFGGALRGWAASGR